MRECDLYPFVQRWLADHGYEIHVEIFDADIVAVKDGKLTAVELKTHLTKELVHQCWRRCEWADYVIAAVGVQPQRDFHRSQLRHMGIGLMVIRKNKGVLRAKPKPQPWAWHKRHAYRLKKITGRSPAMEHERAGVTSPEMREQRLMRQRLEAMSK